MTKGSKNLITLGVGSILIAIITSSVALAVYHNSGDIYLDRSRPGFLPDEEEIKEEEEEDEVEYELSETGLITQEVLDEYLKNINEEIENLEKYNDPFSDKAMSDETLGIPEDKSSQKI